MTGPYHDPEDRPTRSELEPNPRAEKRLGEDPWAPWTCPRCGQDHPDGMPEKCTECGWRNYGA